MVKRDSITLFICLIIIIVGYGLYFILKYIAHKELFDDKRNTMKKIYKYYGNKISDPDENEYKNVYNSECNDPDGNCSIDPD